MSVRWTRSRRTHFWVILLILPALASRLLVPPGFMPGTGADHSPTIQMCHGAGPLPQGTHSPAKGDRQTPVNRTHHEAPCVFAAAGTGALPTISLPKLDGPATPDAIPSPPESVVVHRTLRRANPPRAPPPIVRPA